MLVVGKFIGKPKYGGKRPDIDVFSIHGIVFELRDLVPVAISLSAMRVGYLPYTFEFCRVVSQDRSHFPHHLYQALFMAVPPKDIADIMKMNCTEQEINLIWRKIRFIFPRQHRPGTIYHSSDVAGAMII